ncbi:MAG: hypothetical protein JWM02_693 [Frankiales bacterium]|nr:hypothetical protein [Frankiales bacterium]
MRAGTHGSDTGRGKAVAVVEGISLFGALRVQLDSRELGPKSFVGRKSKQLLEILVLHDGRPVPKDQLAEQLWGESLPANFSAALEHYVSMLRKRLEPGVHPSRSMVRTVHGGYRFDGAGLEVDIVAFDTTYRRQVAGTATRPELEGAVGLVLGDLLEDEPYADWVSVPRADYRKRYVEMLTAAAGAALLAADAARAAELARLAVARDEYAEPAHRLLMLAYYDLGRQNDALQAYENCRRVLAHELGVDPMPQTRSLQAAILEQVPRDTVRAEYVTRRPVDLQVPSSQGEGAGSVLDHFQRLGKRLYRVATTASVFVQPVAPEVLARILGRDPMSVVDDLERLCELKVLQVQDEDFVFCKEATAAVLSAAVSPARRRLILKLTGTSAVLDRRVIPGLMRARIEGRHGPKDRRRPVRAREPAEVIQLSAG